MNDARMSTDVIAFEREREKDAFRACARELAASGQSLGRPRGVLSDEEAAARQTVLAESAAAEAGDGTAGASAAIRGGTVQGVPNSGSAPDDPQVLLRHLRLGVVVIVVLAVLLVWMRRRKRF